MRDRAQASRGRRHRRLTSDRAPALASGRVEQRVERGRIRERAGIHGALARHSPEQPLHGDLELLAVQKDEVLDTGGYVRTLAEDILDGQVDRFVGKQLDDDERDVPGLILEVSRVFGLDPVELGRLDLADKSTEEIGDTLWAVIKQAYADKEQLLSSEILRHIERDLSLQITDAQWKDHL